MLTVYQYFCRFMYLLILLPAKKVGLNKNPKGHIYEKE